MLETTGYLCVRFNPRGIGNSEGRRSYGEPLAECDDLRAVAAWTRERYERVEKVWAVGISYGAVLCAAACARFAEIDGFAAVSYPLDYVWFLTALRQRQWLKWAQLSPKPKLFVWGARDAYAEVNGCLEWYKACNGPKELVLFPTLDSKLGHLFNSMKLRKSLADHVEWWLNKVTQLSDAQDDAGGLSRRPSAENEIASRPSPPPEAQHLETEQFLQGSTSDDDDDGDSTAVQDENDGAADDDDAREHDGEDDAENRRSDDRADNGHIEHMFSNGDHAVRPSKGEGSSSSAGGSSLRNPHHHKHSLTRLQFEVNPRSPSCYSNQSVFQLNCLSLAEHDDNDAYAAPSGSGTCSF